MIYTVGKVDVYLHHWEENGGELLKLGRTDDYSGGSVWQTRAEAQRCADINPGFAVFGVDADWETDTAPSDDPDATFHDLLRDSYIVLLDE